MFYQIQKFKYGYLKNGTSITAFFSNFLGLNHHIQLFSNSKTTIRIIKSDIYFELSSSDTDHSPEVVASPKLHIDSGPI